MFLPTFRADRPSQRPAPTQTHAARDSVSRAPRAGARGSRFGRIAALGLAASVVATLLTVVAPVNVPTASAVTPGSFDPGLIITDKVFWDSSTMTASQIKSFLRAKSPGCVTYTSGGVKYSCLSTYTQATATRAANSNCSKYTGSGGESAATIIYRVGKVCGINPQVILVTLQKEQGLVTGGARSSGIYRKAMGMGCPDTASCNSKYYGFFNQVYSAAWQIQQYRAAPTHFNFRANSTIAVRYSPNASCGSSKVYIRNAATAALYNYTPYQPNQAALTAGTGIGNGCSSYGNRNFFNYFTSWFGNSSNLLTGGSFDGSSTAGWKDVGGNSNFALKRNDSRAQSGTGFVSTSAAVAGRSVSKSFTRSTKAGQSYEGSIWVRAASSDATYSGTLVLSAGGKYATEFAESNFVADDTWREVDVQLDLDHSHSSLKLGVVENTASDVLFLDSASISATVPQTLRTPLVVKSPSFEASSGGWTQGLGSKVHFARAARTSALPAQSGTHYLSAYTNHPSGSVKQDIARKITVGESYTLTAWVRAASAAKPVKSHLSLAALGGISEVTTAKFVADATWKQVSTTVTIKRTGHTKLRIAAYLDSGARKLMIDHVSLVPNLLPNPSFESSATTGWTETAGGAYTATQVTNSAKAADGADYSQLIRTSGATTRYTSDVARNVRAGQTYTVGGWFRSSDATTAYVSELRLIARGGTTDSEVSSTDIEVGPVWTHFTATLKLTESHPALRVDIRAGSMPFALEVDGLTLR